MALLGAVTAESSEMRLMGVSLNRDGEKLESVASRIVSARPDFVMVCNADWRKERSGRVNQGKELERLTGLRATWQVIGQTDASVGLNGFVVLSREKPKSFRLKELGEQSDHGVYACEFADCFIAAGDVARETVDAELARMELAKPVYVPQEGVTTVSVPTREVPDPALVPLPVDVVVGGGVFELDTNEGTEDYVRLIADRDDPAIAPEGYRLEVTSKGIVVTASDAAGRFYARQTLAQLVTPRWGRMVIPCCRIDDRPRFSWRGMHLDEARHFFGKAAVKRFIDQISAHKYNVFHWHLTDNQSWAFPVARHPELAERASIRPYRSYDGFLDRFEDGDYGPNAYTEGEIREIVRHAADRHVRIMPEIDVPGHCRALLNQHPEFRCYDKNRPGAPAGSNDNVLCLGNDAAIAYVEEIFDAVVDMFPGQVIHLGGDEVNRVNWENCPKCKARMEKEGLKSVSDLQLWFMNRIARRLEARGRRAAGWGSAIRSCGLFENEIGFLGCHTPLFDACAGRGYDLVDCSDRHTYYIYNQCLRDDPATYPWFSFPLSLEKAYAYDPLRLVKPENAKRILGGQGYNWTECAPTEAELQWTMFPRACATAEALWTPLEKRDFKDFVRRMKIHRRRLLRSRVNCAPLADAD